MKNKKLNLFQLLSPVESFSSATLYTSPLQNQNATQQPSLLYENFPKITSKGAQIISKIFKFLENKLKFLNVLSKCEPSLGSEVVTVVSTIV
jgi:hypothetical protein